MIRRLAPALLAVACLPALAAASAGVGRGAQQLGLPISVRQLGMGSVGAGGNDVLRGWTNPAALGDLEHQGEVALGGGKLLADSTDFAFGGGYRFTPALTGGVFVARYSTSADLVDAFGDKVSGSTIGAETLGATAACAFRGEWVRVGLGVKMISERLTAGVTDAANAIGVDAGARAVYGPFSGGVSALNLGGALRPGDNTIGQVDEMLPMQFRVGAGYRYDPLHLAGAVEATLVPTRAMELGLGVEWWVVPQFALRAGSAALSNSDERQITLGLTGAWNGLTLDYAFGTHQIGAQHRAALSWSFGAAPEAVASAPEAPAPAKEEPAPPPPAAGSKKLNFAVADLRAENVSAGDAAVMADLFRSELAKTGTFNMVEKQNMDKVLAEHAFQQTGCTSEECAVKLGKLLNVQRMAVGSFGKLLDSYFLNVRVVNVETGEVVFGDSAEGKTVSDLKTGVRDLARRVAAKIR